MFILKLHILNIQRHNFMRSLLAAGVCSSECQFLETISKRLQVLFHRNYSDSFLHGKTAKRKLIKRLLSIPRFIMWLLYQTFLYLLHLLISSTCPIPADKILLCKVLKKEYAINMFKVVTYIKKSK